MSNNMHGPGLSSPSALKCLFVCLQKLTVARFMDNSSLLVRLFQYARAHRSASVFTSSFSILNKIADIVPPILVGVAVGCDDGICAAPWRVQTGDRSVPVRSHFSR
ncbi:MAG: hypothetical protein JXB47_12430 [Anaerolineae bacterium]|nr:hypothetical protein [Anaerolineae bacterium]